MAEPIISSVGGASFWVGDTTLQNTLSGYQAIASNVWTEVNGVESIGDFGDTANEISITLLKDRRQRSSKGSLNGQTIRMTCAKDNTDPGQAAMLAAFASKKDFVFRIIWDDSITDNGAGGVTFFYGKVMSKSLVNGTGPDNIMRRTFDVRINSDQFEQDPT